jgi:hypothetical protein
MNATTTERPHGYARYKLDGCRCYVCGFAVSQYNDQRERSIAYGTWQPFVDAEPVRAHLKTLSEAGIGRRRVTELTGVSGSTLKKILYGRPGAGCAPTARIRPEIAAKILAVGPSPDALAGHALVDATGTLRRLQAMIRRGWPQLHLAARLGMTPQNFSTMLGFNQVTAAKARAVRDLYQRLQNADPTDHGVSAHSRVRAANYGTAHGWPLPAMWDDDAIDDPAAHPDWTGECGTEYGYHLHYSRRVLPACQPCRDGRAAAATARLESNP